jgi:hypothetical protein
MMIIIYGGAEPIDTAKVGPAIGATNTTNKRAVCCRLQIDKFTARSPACLLSRSFLFLFYIRCQLADDCRCSTL